MSGPGHAATPSPARSLCSRRRSPRGRSEGRGGEGAPVGPRRLLCSPPRPPALPPGLPSAARGTKGCAKGAPRGRGAGTLPSEPSTRSPDLGGPPSFFRGSRDEGRASVGWGIIYTKQEAGEIGRPGAENSAPGRLPAQSRLARLARLPACPPAGAPRPPAGLRGMESAPRGRWVGGHGTPAPPAGRGLSPWPQHDWKGSREMFDGIPGVG